MTDLEQANETIRKLNFRLREARERAAIREDELVAELAATKSQLLAAMQPLAHNVIFALARIYKKSDKLQRLRLANMLRDLSGSIIANCDTHATPATVEELGDVLLTVAEKYDLALEPKRLGRICNETP